MFKEYVANPHFQEWLGGDPVGFDEREQNTTIVQLDRVVDRDHPYRSVIRPNPITGLGDRFVFAGRHSYRAVLDAGAAVDDWCLWPQLAADQELGYGFGTLFRIRAGVNDALVWTEAGVAYTTTITAGYYTPADLATELATQMEAAGASVNTYTWTWDWLTRLWSVARAAGADPFGFSWSDLSCTIAPLLGFATDDAGAVAYDGETPSPPVVPYYRAEPHQRWRFHVAARCSVNNDLRVLIYGLSADLATAYYLDTDGRWQNAANYWTFPLVDDWRLYGMGFQTFDQRYLIWRVSNADAGAQTIDIGQVGFNSPVDIAQEGRI